MSKKQASGKNRLLETFRAKLADAKDTDVFSKDDLTDLLEAHEMLLRRFDRVIKISDGYQYELKDKTSALLEALEKVKMLSGLIPVCAACKKVRSEDGYWKQIEQYIIENSEADITHGLCPECAANYMHMLDAEDNTSVTSPKALINFSDEDLEHPVVTQYLSVINNKHFAGSPLYDDLVDLLRKYIRLERRLQRIARISDNYQSDLHEIRSRFEQEAKLDYLTGLSNRRELYRLMEVEVSRSDRQGGTFALIMFDFDQFKTINDRYGHEAGDLVLQKGAQLIKEKLRMEDTCARWGGEEFLILQPGGCFEGVVQCSERLRKTIEQNSIGYGTEKINVTISLGVAIYRNGEKLEDCIDRSDKSMYLAKQAGRNRTGPLCRNV